MDNIEELIPVGECFELRVTGFSMLPLLGYGADTIIVRRTTATEDIVRRVAMFRERDGHIVVHRVLSVDNGIVTLKGDGNIRGTERCSREAIIGVVDKVRRESGRVVSCTTWWWHMRERVWLCQPTFIRRYALAIMRRWLTFKRR